MNLREKILAEHSKAQCNVIVDWVGKSPSRFNQLFQLYLHGVDSVVTQRSGWPVAFCAEHYPELMKGHVGELLANLEKPNLHAAVKRAAVRMLQYINIPEAFHGEVMDRCFRYVEDPGEAIATRAFSLVVLGRLALIYPDIIPEIKLLINSHPEDQSPAFKASARAVMKTLKIGKVR